MENPLLDQRGLPRFKELRPEHVEPAIDRLLTDNRAAIDRLAAQQDPTFESLVEPMEALEHRLGRAWSPVSHLNAVMNNPALREVYNACLPKLSEYGTEVGQNAALFAAYQRVADADGAGGDAARRRLLEHTLRDFRLSGVALEGAARDRFREISTTLSKLQAKFEENLLDATNAWKCLVTDETRLAGLPAAAVERAREKAEKAGKTGWLFALDAPTYLAVVTHADDRALRREFYEAWVTRASDTGPGDGRWDNTAVMEKILALRHEEAQLLGFANFAELSLATKMAASPDEVCEFLEDLAERSRPVAKTEFAGLEAFAGRALEAWDVAYYAEKLRVERHDISQEALRPWFPVDKALDGLFAVAARLFGLEFERGDDVDRWHDDVRFYTVRNAGGEQRGAFYVDLYARAHKRGGAWMDECVSRASLGGTSDDPVAYLVCNFMPPVGDRPALLTHDDVVTLFHEFGHTLHHVLTRVDYPSVAGISGVPWDAVELPSQFMENFAWQPEVLPMISAHYETGEPLPGATFERLCATRVFHAGMQMVRQLEFALFDLKIHTEYRPGTKPGIADILTDVRRRVAVVPTPDFNRFAHGFSHIFGGGYAAGYYSYKWAEVLSADAWSLFEERGTFDPEAGRRFLGEILERGGSVDAMDAFVAFRGRRPQLTPLLRQTGIEQAARAGS